MGRAHIPTQTQVVVAVAAMLVAFVLAYSLWDSGQRGPVVISSDPTLVMVVVEVRGAVTRPGVYSLPGDGRVGQLIELAGGVSADADLRQLNLARRLADEELVFVPSLSAATPGGSPVASSVPPTVAASITGGTALNLNVSSAAELEALPGIGEVLAARIVAYRDANGPFRTVDDLGRVEGISDGLIDKLRPLVTVGP